MRRRTLLRGLVATMAAACGRAPPARPPDPTPTPAPAPESPPTIAPPDPLDDALQAAGFRFDFSGLDGAIAGGYGGADLLLDAESPMRGPERPLQAPRAEQLTEHRALLLRTGRIGALVVPQLLDDLTVLRDLEAVRLWICSRADDLSPLVSLPRLRQLFFLAGSQVRAPGQLAACAALRELLFCGEQLGSQADTLELAEVARLTGLERLTLRAKRMQPLDPGPLASLPRLAQLRLAGCELADLRGIVALPAVVVVELRECRVRSLAGLSPRSPGDRLALRLRRCTLPPADEIAAARAAHRWAQIQIE